MRDRATAPKLLALLCGALAAPAATVPIRSYTVADGLANNHVSRIYRDSHDFMWICTDEGLARFDGRRFVNYTTSDGLPHIHVNDIIETPAGDYWIGTDAGVTLFRTSGRVPRFLTFKPDGPPRASFINALLLDREKRDGSVLVGTGAGLFRMRLNGLSASFEPIDFGAPSDFPTGASVNTLLFDSHGMLWAGAFSGLYGRDSHGMWTRWTQRERLPHDFVDRLIADPEDRIWVCTRIGLARLAPPDASGRRTVDLTLSAANGLPFSDVRALAIAADGRRWIATLGGLVEWLPGPDRTPSFHVYNQREGLLDHEIFALAFDAAGNLWAGTQQGGLGCLKRTPFQTFETADGLGVRSELLVEMPSGTVCAAGILDPLRTVHCLDGGSFHSRVPPLPPEVVRAAPYPDRATFMDHTGSWWISTNSGVFRMKGGPAPHPAGFTCDLRLLPGRDSRRLFEDSYGDLWVTTLNRGPGPTQWEFGLMRWERAAAQVHDHSAALPREAREREITALAETSSGRLWIGLGQPGGLFRWQGDGFQQVPGAPEGTIRTLLFDRHGRLWIASAEAGLGRIDRPESPRAAVRRYTRSEGLSSNQVWSLAEDAAGRIYLGTSRGVDRLDPESGRIAHWTEDDGLPGGEVRSALCGRNGDLWFLSRRGLSRIHPSPADEDVTPPGPRIMAVRVAGTPQPISDNGETDLAGVAFPWYRNTVEIESAAVDFRAPDRLRYQFQLQGGAGGWSSPSPQPAVQFSNLGPGRYRFLVRTIDAAGTASPVASYRFTILPPWWRHWWFLALSAATVIGLTYRWHRNRLRHHLALERVRARIATDLHDDIGASLARIAVMSESIKSRALPAAADAVSRQMLDEIAGTSRALVDGMSDIVWSIDPRRDHLHDVVARLRAFGSDLLESKGIEWSCEEAAGGLEQVLAPDQKRELYLIFKEAVHNIARHSQARKVVLTFEVRGEVVSAAIQDDGCGIPYNGPQGLGLRSMHMRAARINGRLEIAACGGSGTALRLRFPLKAGKA